MRIPKCLLGLAVVGAIAPSARAGELDGVWDAVVQYNKVELPFRIELKGDGTGFTGSYLNGDVKVSSTSGKLEGKTFHLDFDHYLTELDGTLKDGKIEGKFQSTSSRGGDSRQSAFHAERVKPSREHAANVPRIDGLWELPVESPKGEKSWRFIVRQQGDEVSASILRVDGDTGTLNGRYRDGKFVLAHFSGVRPLRVEVTPKEDGTIRVAQFGRPGIARDLVGYRPEAARAKGLPEPADFSKHTKVTDASKPFTFKLPDLDGKTVSNEDARFKGKVVVAVVTGTWCPNCHDEAQYLVQLHKKYRDQGLEVVALDFEEIAEQESGYKRARAFIKQYGVEYPYLLGGDPVEMWVQVPQAENLNSWPTTFFIGRDGLVKRVHSGFASPASGDFHKQAVEQFDETVRKLLAEPVKTAAN
ncbi:peroxiredoxin family protein [Singulisphaera sp. PoT]|uniref:peroxiredoxin family protein n=1 Tax=Singulisphaera sp. PoT TaxID=3411797 RepID=UPI003BF58108